MRTEQSALRVSLVAILCFAALGIVFGWVSGSFAIMFDGVFSLVDAAISLISLSVSSLIASSVSAEGKGPLGQRMSRRFTMGYWHFEPMVLALSSVTMMSVTAYALFQAVQSLLSGGRDVEFGAAVWYAVIVLALSTVVAIVESRANRRLQSALVALDVKGWIMAIGVTGSLLMAFLVGMVIDGTEAEWLMPYIDPGILTLVALVLLPIPLPDLRRALADVVMIAPKDLLYKAETVVAAAVTDYGFMDASTYAVRQGRSTQVEVVFQVPVDRGTRPLEEWDHIRQSVREQLVGRDPHAWVTIQFTTQPLGPSVGNAHLG